MRFGDHDDWLARIGLSPTAETISALPPRVRALVNEAIDIIWAFYRRPLDGGVRWARPAHAENLAAFNSACQSRQDYLVELCRDLRDHDNLSAHDAEVLAVLVDISDFCRGGNGPKSMIGNEAEKGFDHEKLHDETGACAAHTAPPPGLRADFRIGQVQHRVKLRNPSSTGVMIEGAPPTDVGEQAIIGLRGGAWILGNIEWSLGDRCGFAFARLDDPLVDFLRRLFAEGHLDC
jgi:hypothetical protein